MKQIQIVKLRRHTSETQAVTLARRALVTGIEVKTTMIVLNALVEHDEDTRAFDTGQHTRHFSVRIAGDAVPAGALVAFAEGTHVFEVQP